MRHSSVRRGLSCGITALAFALAGCGSDSTPTNGGGNGNGNGNGGGNGNGDPVETTEVDLGNNFFDPEEIQVAPGAEVTWTWVDGGVIHTVTFDDTDVGESDDMSSGEFTLAMPSTPGEYPYECIYHPAQMQGTVIVE